MEKFRIDQPNPAIIDLLVHILANQHTFIAVALKDLAEKTGQDHGEMAKEFDRGVGEYREYLWGYLLETFGRLDVDDLIE